LFQNFWKRWKKKKGKLMNFSWVPRRGRRDLLNDGGLGIGIEKKKKNIQQKINSSGSSKRWIQGGISTTKRIIERKNTQKKSRVVGRKSILHYRQP